MDPAVGDFSWLSLDVNAAFAQTLDNAFPSQFYIAALLERGVRALVYVGDTDFMCNWVRVPSNPVLYRVHAVSLADRERANDSWLGMDRSNSVRLGATERVEGRECGRRHHTQLWSSHVCYYF